MLADSSSNTLTVKVVKTRMRSIILGMRNAAILLRIEKTHVTLATCVFFILLTDSLKYLLSHILRCHTSPAQPPPCLS